MIHDNIILNFHLLLIIFLIINFFFGGCDIFVSHNIEGVYETWLTCIQKSISLSTGGKR